MTDRKGIVLAGGAGTRLQPRPEGLAQGASGAGP